jgi:GTPase SAR1 family protein
LVFFSRLLVIVIGDAGVGKTGLWNRWHNNTFAPQQAATVNGEFKTKSFLVKGEIIQVQFWDTGE